MMYGKSSSAVVAALVLSGCQSPEAERVTPPSLAYQPLEKHYVEPGCQRENCSEVKVSSLGFPDAPALSDELQRRLLALAMDMTDTAAVPPQEWDDYAEAFFARADEDSDMLPQFMASEAQMETSVYAQHDGLLVLELTSYVYHAGQAHGLPSTAFMVIDERQSRAVSLDDMLLDGQESAFQQALLQAHRRWMAEMGYDDQYVINWPLSESRNVAPLEDSWVVKFNVYEIAPYAVGQPELFIPLEELEGVAKPRYLGQ
ncbi:DUF3298 domain-containing protein [Halomonas aquamarina]|uniref:DUF3298 domain-containing protein n=1 Tax=Vreelandella aquamarina TaxID=77097 RepID=A0ACC5VTV3_9GAMM|nr:RsiV family protein [Halomonas aquamarina]MBZ5487305.1 DUF3298 domain-containing protein [Halomonas aquamarina]